MQQAMQLKGQGVYRADSMQHLQIQSKQLLLRMIINGTDSIPNEQSLQGIRFPADPSDWCKNSRSIHCDAAEQSDIIIDIDNHYR
ncbi:hypothetical protein ACFSQ7_03495 [Paenibacillus rhizoplanae]